MRRLCPHERAQMIEKGWFATKPTLCFRYKCMRWRQMVRIHVEEIDKTWERNTSIALRRNMAVLDAIADFDPAGQWKTLPHPFKAGRIKDSHLSGDAVGVGWRH